MKHPLNYLLMTSLSATNKLLISIELMKLNADLASLHPEKLNFRKQNKIELSKPKLSVLKLKTMDRDGITIDRLNN